MVDEVLNWFDIYGKCPRAKQEAYSGILVLGKSQWF